MDAKVLQDWTTVRGASTVVTITQNESDWLDVSQYQDVTFFLLVREVASGGAVAPLLKYQTAPLKDERLFTAMASIPLLAASLAAPNVTAVLTSTFTTNTAVGLGAWLRWQIVPNGPSSTWDVTFRIVVALNRVMTFPPLSDADAHILELGGDV